jgi:DNA-directed RNA polymerase specialized sigma24 family protein
MTDDAAFTLFLHYHRKALKSHAFKASCGNERDADEGLSTALRQLRPEILALFRAIPEVERSNPKSAIPPLLWVRIRDRVIDIRRREMPHDEVLVPMDDAVGDQLECQQHKDFLTSGVTTDVETLKVMLRIGWNELSETEAKVIELLVLREPPAAIEEAAEILKTSYNTVKGRKCGALRKLLSAQVKAAMSKGCGAVLSATETQVVEMLLLRDPPVKPKVAVENLRMNLATINQHRTSGLTKLSKCLVRKLIDESERNS